MSMKKGGVNEMPKTKRNKNMRDELEEKGLGERVLFTLMKLFLILTDNPVLKYKESTLMFPVNWPL